MNGTPTQTGRHENNETEQRGDVLLPLLVDRRAAIRARLVRLARNVTYAGAVYQAVHACTEIMVGYPGTATVSAAAALAETRSAAEEGFYGHGFIQ